jgi:WD40 repeat protein
VIVRLAIWLPVLGFGLVFATSESRPVSADSPKEVPKSASKEDKLPKGAKLRLGDTRLVFRFAPAPTLLPPDYKAFALADGLEELQLFDVATGQPLEPAKKPSRNFGGRWMVVISGDGKRFVTNPSLTVREVPTGKEINTLKLPGGFNVATLPNIPTASLSADGKVMAQGGTGMGDKAGVVVWDVEKGTAIFQTGIPLNGAAIPVLSRDGKLVAIRGPGSGGLPPDTKPEDDPNRMVWVYEVESGKELLRGRLTPGAQQTGEGFAFAPDNSVLAASFGEGPIDVFDLKTGKRKSTILGRTGQGVCVAISPDSKSLAAVSTDGAIQRWNLADGKPLSTTTGPAAPSWLPRGLAFADNERILAWSNVGTCPLVWEAPSGKVLTQLPEHLFGIRSIAFAVGGKEILTTDEDGHIARWDATAGKLMGPVPLKPTRGMINGIGIGSRLAVDLMPDGTKAVTDSTPAAVMDLASGTEEFVLPRSGRTGCATSQIPSADMTKIINFSVPYEATLPARCTVWDLVTRQKVIEVELPVHPGSPPRAAISPSGKRMVTTYHVQTPPNNDLVLMVTGWDLKTGKKIAEVEDEKAGGHVFVAAVNDSHAIVSSGSGMLKAYDYEIGRPGEVLAADRPKGELLTGPVVVSPDGKRFASAGPSEERGMYAVKVHDWPSGRVLHTFTGHNSPISAIAFSPDGKTLATGSHDTTVLLWDLSAGK